jgi:hypothetical protein
MGWLILRMTALYNSYIHTSIHSHCRCLDAVSNSGRSPFFELPNSPWPELSLSKSTELTATQPQQFSDSKSKPVQVMLPPLVSRPVPLGIKHPSGTHDQMFIIFSQLLVCWFGSLSLTRGRISNLYLLLSLASVASVGFESCRTHDHVSTLSKLISQPGGSGPRIYIPQKQEDPLPSDRLQLLFNLTTFRYGLRRNRIFHYCCSFCRRNMLFAMSLLSNGCFTLIVSSFLVDA